MRFHWIIDNGHGSLTAGKRSPVITNQALIQEWGVADLLKKTGGRFMEYEFNRDIACRLANMLHHDRISHTLLVPEVEIGDFLKGRVDRANTIKSKLPSIFLSIHSNAAPAANVDTWANAKGAEVLYMSDNNANFARIFLDHIVAQTKFVNRGIKKRTNLYVLKNTRMPAILTESGFFNNNQEVMYLLSERGRDAIAKAHYYAIKQIESMK
jgi:N-acetylmuramoyl-L-alanine amidase